MIMRACMCVRTCALFKAELEHQSNDVLAGPGTLKVAFSAGLTDSGSVGPFDDETTLIFSKTFSNVGGSYNQSTGEPGSSSRSISVGVAPPKSSCSPSQACSQLLSEDFTSSASQPLIT